MEEIDWLVWALGLIIGSAITWFFSWKYGNRRRKLLFTWDAVQLMPNHEAAGGELEVSYEGQRLKDPYILKITLKNMGPTDITTAHFDNARPLQIKFPDGYVATIDGDMGAAEAVELGSDYLGVHPVLLKRGEPIFLDVLVDGPTIPYVNSSIIDTDVVTADAKDVALNIVEQTVGLTAEGFVLGAPGLKAVGQLAKRIATRR